MKGCLQFNSKSGNTFKRRNKNKFKNLVAIISMSIIRDAWLLRAKAKKNFMDNNTANNNILLWAWKQDVTIN